MTLVNLAEIAWSLERRRNAAMFVNLLRSAAFEKGIFVDPPLYSSRATALARRAREGLLALRPRATDEGFLWYRPSFFVPFHARPLVFRSSVALFAAVLGRALRGQDYCLWINNIEPGPFALAQALAKKARKVVLDLSDDWTTFRDLDPAARDRRLQAALAMADVVIAVNEHVLAKFPHRSGRVFPNATDFLNFQRHDPHYRLGDVLPRRPGQRIVGFVGGLHVGRVDEALLHRLIAATPDATFLFVGYSNSEELLGRLREHGNVVVHPAVPYRDLPSVIRAFDVAIVPHLINEYTRGNDLLKVLDYLACGVPCVSTDCSNVRKYGSALHVADSADAFVATVRALLDGRKHDPAPGLAAARAASWERTVPELGEWLATALA
jgi:glycosyltransferase involved in cell wall biosynthesis